ncbi:TetR/AcrR family transcriptional regulator [Novosphingobium sp. P6W]|jgi:AcrR family transcriptional regulator|uniref:TetR/AcrR family transcriptional regulator n=1 Tax=Novosphingobium sp. P6W TaxID=1609758 RepID=UPI0005C729FB|nr:TetR/AcrR family transcriptional regulator [Novosphingobium sp. P6W]AXB79567.1 TetR/AcrR family transcriptional regulator [Novosphingobium sp. P6W]
MKCSAPNTAPTASRGRPREFDPDKALASALRVFWTRGYEGASMAELTEAMGITKPSLYACFGNKEALFKKALELYERDKLAYVGKALDAPTARGVAERLLNGAVATHCGTSDPHGCLGVISTVACATEDDSIREHVIARRIATEAAIAQRFLRAQSEGDLPGSVDAKALAGCLTTVLQGMSVKAQGCLCPTELQGTVDSFLSMWPSR